MQTTIRPSTIHARYKGTWKNPPAVAVKTFPLLSDALLPIPWFRTLFQTAYLASTQAQSVLGKFHYSIASNEGCGLNALGKLHLHLCDRLLCRSPWTSRFCAGKNALECPHKLNSSESA